MGSIRAVRDRALKGLFGRETHPSRLGRYVILSEIGSGGMGRVYAAHDPELGRSVAVKLIRPSRTSPEHTARLMREAQAMARLSHPNVATVYDVGEQDGDVFIAMELIEGQSLRQWLREGPHAWPDVLARFQPAAKGLAHAHSAGLIHRDFKPDNVMVTRGGVVKVLDFGLARASDSSVSLGAAGVSGRSEGGVLDGELTAAGSVVGTPNYMAPEQHRNEADAAADQFSFCVALYEALVGSRPFEGRTLAELAERKNSGLFAPPAAAPELPALPHWLVAAVTRGLSVAPRDRHRDMSAVSASLQPPRPRRAAALLSAVALGAVAVAVAWPSSSSPGCADAESSIATSWGSEQRDAVRESFAATGIAYAPRAATAAERELDAYAAQWTDAYRSSCGAAEGELFDARLHCLALRRAALDAVVRTFSEADADTVEGASATVAGLPALRGCDDPEQRSIPADHLAAVSALELELVTARMLGTSGRTAEALELAAALVARADATSYDPLRAEIKALHGRMLARGPDHESAEAELRDAAMIAERSGADKTAATAWIALVELHGSVLAQPDEAARAARHAEASVARAGEPPVLVAWLAAAEAKTHATLGEYAKASELAARALAMREEIEPRDTLDLARSHTTLGQQLANLGRFEDARGHFERALELDIEAVGDGHPYVAADRLDLGTLAIHERKLEVAEPLLEAALADYEAAFGPDHHRVGVALHNLANARMLRGRNAEAAELFRRGIDLSSASMGEDHPFIGRFELGLGSALLGQRKAEEALVHIERGRVLTERSFGSDHIMVGIALGNMGNALVILGRPGDAIGPLRESVRIQEIKLGREHHETFFAVGGLGEALELTGDCDEATPLLRRALALAEDRSQPEDLVKRYQAALKRCGETLR